MKKHIFILSVIFIAVLFIPGCKRTDTIKIGTIMPISGQISAFGTQCRDAILLAAEEINAKGGVLGKKIEIITEDDEATPDKTMNAFIKLVTKDKVAGLIGALTSKCTLAITKDAQARKVILITPTSTNDTITDAGDYIFRTCYTDSFQGQVCAQFAFDTLKAKKAAVLFDITNDYSKGLMSNFKSKFETLGGKVTAETSYSTGDKDFNAQITKIKALNPEVIFIPDYYSTVSLIVKQIRNQGISIPLLGGDGWDEITNNAGDEALNGYYSNHYSNESDNPEVKNFIAKFRTKYNNQNPNALAALGYDTANILIDAIIKAGSTDPEKIKAALIQTNKKLVTGAIQFNENRNPIKSVVMLRIIKKDGKIVTEYAGTVNP